VRRNSDATGSWRQLRWLGMSARPSGDKAGPHVAAAPLDGAAAVLNGRTGRDVHIRMRMVHEPGRRVDGMGIDFVGKAVSTRVLRPQDHRRAAPGLTVADLADRRAGERRA
jgi:hypothetical protein